MPTRQMRAAEKSSDDPKIQAAVDRAVNYLRGRGEFGGGGEGSLATLAMLKGGLPVDSPSVKRGIGQVISRVQNGVYQPEGHHYYTAGIQLMLLEAADAKKYRPQMEAIVAYIIKGQLSQGGWTYPGEGSEGGDTSITQYAMLGLWTAARAGIDIPTRVWDRAAAWHVNTQRTNGGFAYHPEEEFASPPKHTMTAAAVGSLHIARLHLYPGRGLVRERRQQQQRPRKFRFLERVDIDNPASPDERDQKKPKLDGKPTTELTEIDGAIKRGINWLAGTWSFGANDDSYFHYYLYALERMTALADIRLVGQHDWYKEASEFLLRTQQSDGSWSGADGEEVDTSFGLMCLTKATAQMLNRKAPSVGVGVGLLAGGRGLPDNLAQVQVSDGKVKARKLQGPLDELLNQLENPKSTRVESLQSAVLERVQLGNREELIGQKERLARLVKDPRAEVRRIALWALGRSNDVRYAPLLIAALEDTDPAVMVEARNALCTLSRKPRGFGLPDHPDAGLTEDAKESERLRARARWRAAALRKWRQWHFTVRPYDQRDDLSETKQKK